MGSYRSMGRHFDILLLLLLRVIYCIAGSREIKTCPGAKGITGGCPGGGIIKLKSLIVGANIRSPEVSCGQFRPKDCRDLKHTFKFYTFVQFDASRFDESVAVPGFESTCYDENLVQNKYIHLKYACITANTIARLGENKTISSMPEIQILNKAYPNITLGKVKNYTCKISGPAGSTVNVTLIRSRVVNADKNISIIVQQRSSQCTIPHTTFESNFGKDIYTGRYPVQLFFNSSEPAISMMWLSIKDANGGRISAECYNGGPSLLQLTEVCLSPVTPPSPTVSSTSPPVHQTKNPSTRVTQQTRVTTTMATTTIRLNQSKRPHNEMTESKNSTKTTATTTPITTIFQGITSITNEIETPAKFENTTANTAPSKNEISEQDAEFTTQSGVTTENVTNGNGTLQGTLMREQFVVDEAVIIGPVVVAIVIILLILIIIFFVKRRRGMQCVCTQVPKSHDSDAIELESTTISHPDGGLHNAPDADINESNQSSNNMEHVTENYHNVYATADESRVRLPPEGMSIDGDYDAIAIQVENDKLNNLVPSVDDYKSKRIEQHGDTNKINHLSTQSDTNPINQITAIEPVVRDSECSKTSTNDLYTHVKKQDIKSKQIKTVDTQGDIPKNPKVPEKTWGDQTYSDVTLSKGNINGEFVRESQMVENEIYNDSVIPPCYQTENALSKHINLTHDENTTVRESQMIENDLYNDVNVDNNIEKFPGLGTSVGEDINATNERDIPVRANQMIDNDIYNDTSTKQSQDFEKTK